MSKEDKIPMSRIAESVEETRKAIQAGELSVEKFWMDNFTETSVLSKWIRAYGKENYKGFLYVPWFAMEIALKMIDPTANVEYITTEDGSLVHQETSKRYYRNVGVKDGSKEPVETIVDRTDTIYYVKGRLELFGNVYEDIYTVQDNAYASMMFLNDSNAVNKALKSLKRRLISLATGIAAEFYMNTDETEVESQFKKDEPAPITTPTPVKTEDIEVKEPTEGVDINIAEKMTYLYDITEKIVHKIPKGEVLPKGFVNGDPGNWKVVTKGDHDNYLKHLAAKELDALQEDTAEKEKEALDLLQAPPVIIDENFKLGETGVIPEEVSKEKEVVDLLRANKDDATIKKMVEQINRAFEAKNIPTIDFNKSDVELIKVFENVPQIDLFLGSLKKKIGV